jgi:hypothetical protein
MSSWLNNSLITKKATTNNLEPLFLKNDKDMFYKYLDKATKYFEYGSGGSTYQASLRKNLITIHSVESDLQWHNKLKKMIKRDDIIFIYNEMDTQPNTYGHPGPKSTDADRIRYSDHIKSIIEPVDFILIDGRFRVACCLKCFDRINSDCLIAFDDFLNRDKYHIVLDYYDIIDKTGNNRMVILKKKDGAQIPEEIIKKYELIPD